MKKRLSKTLPLGDCEKRLLKREYPNAEFRSDGEFIFMLDYDAPFMKWVVLCEKNSPWLGKLVTQAHASGWCCNGMRFDEKPEPAAKEDPLERLVRDCPLN